MYTEPKIDEEVQKLDPLEAYNWLLDRFKAYMHNEIIWIDVRSIFLNAEALRSKFCPPEPIQIEGEPEDFPEEPSE